MGGAAEKFSGSSGGEGGTQGGGGSGVAGVPKKYSVFAILILILVDDSFSFRELRMDTAQSWHAVEHCLRDFHP